LRKKTNAIIAELRLKANVPVGIVGVIQQNQPSLKGRVNINIFMDYTEALSELDSEARRLGERL
jgi:hypothetical protein